MNDNVKYLFMLKQFGNQVCLMASLDHTSGDSVIIMESSLQHTTRNIAKMA